MSMMTAKTGARAALAIALSVCLLVLLGLSGCDLLGGSSDKKKATPASDRGFFSISVPGAGTSVRLDSTQPILWAPSEEAATGNVRIALYQDEKLVVNLATSASNSGAYSWRPISYAGASNYRLGSGTGYRIRITSVADTGMWDYSGTFALYSPDYKGSLEVTTPGAGAKVRMDSTYGIRWTATGDIGDYLGIQLFRDTTLFSTLTVTAPPSGYYLWSSISSYLGGLGSGDTYRLRVFSVNDPSISALSPVFSIVSSYSGTFNVTSPEAGDTLVAGNTYVVEWSAGGNPGTSARVALMRDSILVSTLTSLGAPSGSWDYTPSAGLPSSNRYRIRVTSSSDPGIVGYSGYFTVKGIEPDAYEKDDSLKLAKSIPFGQAQQRTLTSLDQDWISFTATAGKHYLLNARAEQVYLTGGFYDSTGLLIQSGSGSSTGMQLTLSPDRSGKYYARIYAGSGYGSYNLTLSEYDSTESPFEIEFTAPVENTTWAAGSIYTIRYVPDSLAYGTLVSLALYQGSALVSSITSGISNSGSYSWSIPAGTFTSDDYRIRISSYYSSQVFAYSPEFTISGVTPDAFEPDNQRTAAKTLAADGKSQSRNLITGDVDWIRIQVQKEKRYLAAINSTSGSVYGYLLDSAGLQQTYLTGSQFTLAVNPTYTGDYYLRVQPYSSTATSYTVSLVAYDSSQNGFPVKFTAPDSGTTWAAGSSYTLGWSSDAVFGSTVSLALYLDTVFVRSITSGITNSGTYSWSVPAGLTSSSRYRIRLSNYSSSGIWGYSPYFTISGLAPDTFEPDNARASAKSIAVDGTAQQRSMSLNDTDWVSFDAAPGKSYLVTASSSTTSLYLYLLDSLGTQLNYTTGTRPSLLLNPTRKGKHYARLQYYSGTGAYTLSVVSFDTDGGGVPVKFTAPAESTTWAAGSTYPATWTPDSALFGTYVGLALYKDTTLIYSYTTSASNSGTYSVSLPLGLGSSNRYRLRMTNYSNAQIYGYSPYFAVSGMPADSLEPNDTAGAARAVEPNSGRRNLSLSYRDRDWFRFTAVAGSLYLIQATSASTVYTTMRLYSGLGTTTLTTSSKTSSLDSLNTITWVPTTGGVYSVSVEPYSTSYTGNYGFEIKEIDPASYKLTVTSPAAASSVRMGTVLPITWTDPSSLKGYVDIFLYDGNGVVQTIAASVSNTGTFSWSVPTTLTAKSDYSIKVISRTSDAISGTSSAFAIAAP